MSTVVDERVVQMQFDNKQFESGVSTTLSTLGKLKNALKFDGASKGLEDINTAAGKCNLSGLSNSVETVRLKFSALDTVARTVLASITNTALNAGKQIVSALAFQPVMSGFHEYETQINAVQTILANTSSTQAEVSQQAIQEVNDMAEQASATAVQANERAMENLQRSQQEQVKYLQKNQQIQSRALQKSQQEQTKALQKNQQAQAKALREQLEAEQEELAESHAEQVEEYETRASEEISVLKKSQQEQLDVFEEQAEAELDALEKSHKQQLKEYESNAKAELDILEDNYDRQTDALEKSIDEETKLLKKSHEEKLDLYHEEYMQKIKATDEDRYKELKALDNEIDSINELTEAEDAEKKASEEQRKLAELKNAVYNAETIEDYTEAVQRLNEYEEELERNKVLKERENRIEELEAQKDEINERYDLINEKIEEEYNARKENENDFYETESENLKTQQSEKKDELKKTYEYEKDLIKERQEEEKDALKEQQDVETEALKARQEAEREALQERLDSEMNALNEKLETERSNLATMQKAESDALSERQEAESEALSEQQEAEMEALSDRQQSERDALSERQEAESDALSERQKAEMQALQDSHNAALQNIEDEKNARIKALNDATQNTRKPSTLEDVNNALDELNEYADKTIYNFTEMTRNIGMFTAAGVDLDTSVEAIKGIANLAAMSGANSEQASRAMYQLSQALATGKVQLQDWNSVVTANIGGKPFQNALLETARVHGIAVDEIIAKEGSFRQSLQEGWLSSDILLETLRKFTGDMTEEELRSIGYTEDQIKSILELGQTAVNAATEVKTFSQLWNTLTETAQSGWTNTWETIIGDYDEARTLWTNVYDALGGIIEKQADARNQLLEGWKDMGGRTDLIESIKNIFSGVSQVIEIFKKSMEGIIPEVTSEKLYNFTKNLRDLTSHFKLNREDAEKLKETFKGLFSAIDIVTSIVKGALQSAFKVIKNLFGDTNGNVLDLTSSVGNAISKFREWLNANNIIKDGFDKLADIVIKVTDKVKEWIKSFVSLPQVQKVFTDFKNLVKDVFENFGTYVDNAIDSISNFIKKIGDWITAFMELPQVQTALSNFSDILHGIWDSISSYFQDGVECIKGFIDRVKEMDGISLENIQKIVKDFIENVIGYFTNFSEVFNKVKTAITGFFDKIKTNAEETGTKFSSAFDNIVTGITNFKDGVKKGLEEAGDLFSYLYKKVTEIVGKITDFIDKHFGQIFTTVIVTGVWKIVNRISSAYEKFSGFAEKFVGLAEKFVVSFAGIGKSISGFIDGLKNDVEKVLGSISGAFKAYASEKKSEALKNAAISIAILAGSIALLTLLDQEKLKSSAIALGEVAVALGVFVAALGIMKKFGLDASDASKSVLGLATSFLLIIGALKAMEVLNAEKLKGNIEAIGVIAAGLVAAMAILGKTGTPQKGALSFVGMAASIKILVGALKDLAKIDSDKIGSCTAVITVLMGVFTLMNKFSGGNNKSLSYSVSLLAMAESINILVDVVKKLSKIKVEDIASGVLAITVIMGVFALLTRASKSAGANAAKAGTMILEMSASLILIAAAIKMLGSMDTEVVAKGTIVVGILEAMSVVLMAFSKLSGENASKAGSMFLKMSASMILLAGAMTIIANLDTESIIKGLAAITEISLVFDILMQTSAKVEKGGSGKILLLVGAVIALAAAVAVLSAIDTESLLGASASLSLVIGMFSLLVASTKVIGDSQTTIIMLTLAVTALSVVLYQLANLPVDKSLAAAGSLSMLLLSLSTSCLLMSNMHEPAKGAYAALLTLTAVTAALGVVIGALASVNNIESALGIAASLSVLLLSMSASLAILQGVGPISAGALIGIGELTAVVTGIGALLTLLGKVVTDNPELVSFLDKGIGMLETLATGIGNFFGNIIGGFLDKATAGIEAVGTHLSNFMSNATPFFNGMSSLASQPNITSGIAIIADTIYTLTESNLINGIGQFLGISGSMEDFGNDLAKLGEGIASFAASVEGVTTDKVEAAANAAGLLADLNNNIPASGGKIQEFFGEKDLGGFGDNLKNLGTGIKNFADSVEGVDTDQVAAAANATGLLADLNTNIPASGGKLQSFLGEKNLGEFGENLKNLGTGIKNFATAVEGIDTDQAASAANAADIIANLQNNLPAEGGTLQAWFGEKDLASFAEKLFPFGVGLSNYSNAVKGVDPDAVKNSAEAAKSLAELENSLNSENGFWQLLTGEKSLENFGINLTSFGQGLAALANSVDDAALTMIESIIGKAKEIVGFSDDLEGSNFAENLLNFGGKIESLGSGIASFYGYFSDVNLTTLSQIITQVNSLVDMAKGMSGIDTEAMGSFGENLATVGQNGIDAFLSKFDGGVEKVKTSVDNILNAIIVEATAYQEPVATAFEEVISAGEDAMINSYSDFETIGVSVVTAFLNAVDETTGNNVANYFKQIAVEGLSALNDYIYEFGDAGRNSVNEYLSGIQNGYSYDGKFILQRIAIEAIDTLRWYQGDFYNAGTWVISGFTEGMNSMSYTISIVAHNLAVEALNSMMYALQIHSPSKETYALGEYFDEGFIGGLKNLAGKVSSTSTYVGDRAIDGMNSAIESISSLTDFGEDMQPTIKPIMDLSEIQNGTDRIYSMMNRIDGYALSGSYNLASDTMRNMDQRRVLNDSAVVEELKKAIENLNSNPSQNIENTFNITGNNPREIADEVSRRIQMQYERRKVALGS